MGTVSVPGSTPVSFQGLQIGFFLGQKETGAERVAMATPLRVSFCFFCDAHLWCQVSRNLALIFPRVIPQTVPYSE